ncbi:MAG TPA: RNase adapter RapZ [Acidimicrobiales bacterium]|jgi:UPF0042 nucleotide-binding protein
MSEFLVVTGLSGAGRSTAAASLEDLGWYVIDNLPPALVSKVADLVGDPGGETERVALVIGRGGGELEDVPGVLAVLRGSRRRVRLLFLDAPNDVLVRRFEGTRRRHPMGARGVQQAIDEERRLLSALREEADIVLDTGDLNVNQLRTRILEMFGEGDDDTSLQISILSFGYKHGVPLDVDLLFDCRFLPNPYWSDELRHLSGLDAPVRDFVIQRTETQEFLGKVDELLSTLLPAFVREGKSYLTVAMGCTGGRHRSVALAVALADRMRLHGVTATVFHRDVDR